MPTVAFYINNKGLDRLKEIERSWYPDENGNARWSARSKVIQHLIATADPNARPERKEEGAG